MLADETSGDREMAVDKRLQLALARAGRQLDDDQRRIVRSRIERQLEMAHLVRAVPLAHDDEPAHEFSPSHGLAGAGETPRL